jgi:hypothetical protein
MAKTIPTGIAVSIMIPNEVALKVADQIMANFPESSQTLRCTDWKYDQRQFKFTDTEEGKKYTLDEAAMLKGFALMYEPGKWPKGLKAPPACAEYNDNAARGGNAWDDWLCDSDAFSFDAFVQLCLLGDVIYG